MQKIKNPTGDATDYGTPFGIVRFGEDGTADVEADAADYLLKFEGFATVEDNEADAEAKAKAKSVKK